MALRISLDRDLPVSISAQLAGQIEYGIVSGALIPGEQLPSVRDLAAAEGIAHVTVSHVYRTLKRDGLITVKAGMGTYVADTDKGRRSSSSLAELQRMVDLMVGQAVERGFTRAEISQTFTARLPGRASNRPLIALVGMFGQATEVYAGDLRALLAHFNPDVVPYTIERLRFASDDELQRFCEADLVLTPANKLKEVAALLPRRHPPVRGLTFVVHPDTIKRLQALPSHGRLGLISTFEQFLPTMLAGVLQYAGPVKPPVCSVLSDVERVNVALADADAVIYATGSEAIISHARRGIPVIEYLHTPEQSSVDALGPLLEQLSMSMPREVPNLQPRREHHLGAGVGPDQSRTTPQQQVGTTALALVATTEVSQIPRSRNERLS